LDNKLHNYPALLVLLPLISGIIFKKYLIGFVPSLAILLLLLLTLVLIYFIYVKNVSNPFLLIPIFILGVLLSAHEENRFPSSLVTSAMSQGRVSFIGKVNKTNQYQQSIDLNIDAIILENDSLLTDRIDLRVFLPDEIYKIEEGDSILVNGRISIPKGARNPGGFNFKSYYRSEGIDGYIRNRDLASIKVLSKVTSNNGNIFNRLHRSIQSLLEEHLSKSNSSLINALLLGNRSGLSEDSKDLFLKNGVVHLLAVSGLHVGYIIGILFLTGSVLQLNRKVIVYLILIGIVFYAALLGWKTPITRAVIMGSILLLGGLTERRSIPLNSLGIAALLILVIKPYALLEIGFQLSFIAVGSILFFSMRYGDSIPLPNPVNLPKKLLRWVLSYSLLTLYALIGIMPLTLFYFNSFSTGVLLLNIIVIPYVGMLIALSIIAILFSYLYQPVGAVFFSSLETLTNQLFALLSFSMNNLSKTIIIGSFPWYLLLLLFGLTITFGFIATVNGRKRMIIFLLLISNIMIWRSATRFRGSEVIFMNVGQGDAAFIEGFQSKNILIDTGRSDYGVKSGKYAIGPYLRSKGIHRINYLLFTHADSDHTGGARYIMDSFEVETLLLGIDSPSSNSFEEILYIAKNKDIPVKKVALGDKIKLGENSEMQVMNPPNNYIIPVNETGNNSSVVIRYKFGNSSILFAGDIEVLSEEIISNSELFLVSNLLKVPHHGSKSSSSKLFLGKVSPTDAIISVGSDNPYGHPSQSVVERYQKNRIRVHRTDKDDAIIFRSEGEKFRLYNWK